MGTDLWLNVPMSNTHTPSIGRLTLQLQAARSQLAAYKAIGNAIDDLMTGKSDAYRETLETELTRLDATIDEFIGEVEYLVDMVGKATTS